MLLRLIGLQAIVPFTLRICHVARDAFMRLQRFSTNGRNSFAGSTVRKITRACGRSICSTTPS